MARRPARQVNQRYVSGNLAYDYDVLERERRREERRQQEERRARERRPAPRRRPPEQQKKKRRERIRVSNAIVVGFAAAAVMIVALLMGYAQLSVISHDVVREQKRLNALEEEHVKLVAQYERTFDLSAIKEAAESSGMAKPSASQIYYVDLSGPDSVVLYGGAADSPLKRVFTAVGQNVWSFVEYFK
ncbi:MAG: hypothetical protein IKN81_02915 [Oscillospiraceae bacterium]|nr:hypothetical protein [Oscillospiraceae bacterium]